MKWFCWFGMMTPEQRARKEISGIDRDIYDAEKSLHSARATLAYLSQRRDFLITQYGFTDPPSSFDSLSALTPQVALPVKKATKRPAPRLATREVQHSPGPTFMKPVAVPPSVPDRH